MSPPSRSIWMSLRLRASPRVSAPRPPTAFGACLPPMIKGAAMNVSLSTRRASQNAPADLRTAFDKHALNVASFQLGENCDQIPSTQFKFADLNTVISQRCDLFFITAICENDSRCFIRGRNERRIKRDSQTVVGHYANKQVCLGLRLRSVRLGSSTRAVLAPIRIASYSWRRSCTRCRARLPESAVETLSESEIRPSRDIASFRCTNGRSFLCQQMNFSLSLVAGSARMPVTTSIPAASQRLETSTRYERIRVLDGTHDPFDASFYQQLRCKGEFCLDGRGVLARRKRCHDERVRRLFSER